MSDNQTLLLETLVPTELGSIPENRNLLSESVRVTGMVFMSISLIQAIGLAFWVLWYRRDPVVKAMQPLFLFLLCFGTIITNFGIVPLGANDDNTTNIEGACLATDWLLNTGNVITLSALFSKLWRVNQIFHAEGFQRKVVTVWDVLKPFGILLALNLLFLIVLSTVEPPFWEREPIDDKNPHSTYGYCNYEGWGILMQVLLGLTNFIPLVILCVQAYRARDIRSEFSEARGVALALFSWLQAIIITVPVAAVLGEENTDAFHMLGVMQNVVPSWSMLFFIFFPLISHQRQRSRRGSSSTGHGSSGQPTLTRTHITGLECDTRMIGTTISTVTTPPPGGGPGSDHHQDENGATISKLETEVQALRARVAELEGDPRLHSET